MISQTAEYALRATVHLAQKPEESLTAQQIATAIQVPLPYLCKVLQALARAKIIRSQRGLYGGFTLQGSPQELTVYQVVQAVDPWRRIQSCPLDLAEHDNLCPLHRRLDAVLEQIERTFRATTIAEILQEPSSSSPCGARPSSRKGAKAQRTA